MRKQKANDPAAAFYQAHNELIDWMDKLAEALIKETRWGSATFYWGREWQKAREEDQ